MHNNSELIKNRLKVLVDFREECAIVKNMPRSFFATNLELIQISKQLPTTTKELVALRLNKRMIAREQFRTKLFEICEGLKNQL
jgi:ribonuclease D